MRRLVAVLLAVLIAPHAWGGELRIAVAEFDNAADTSDYDALGKGLQAMLTTDLSQVDSLVLVERDRLSDVVSELELAGSGLVDPATAAEVGKLLGATHVVAGTFTVVGDAMRLDARLVQVSSGEVVVAAGADGERDAFFELEKGLVRDLLAALDAELSPKERAAVARIHTADFGAFERFSEGVALYDQERYDEAVATLKQVLSADEEFRLAERTLESYEQLIADIRAKSRAIELTEAEAEFVARQEQARFEASVVARLYDIADSPAATFEDRVTALYLLFEGLKPFGRFRELHDTEDQFALARAGEVAYARMFAEVRPRWPEMTPFHNASFGTWFKEDRPFEDTFDYARRSLIGGSTLRDMNTCGRPYEIDGDAADRLHLDVHERAAELVSLAELGRDCLSEDETVKVVRMAAERHAELLDLDRSTGLLEALAASTTDTAVLTKVEHLVAQNRELKEALSGESAPTYREWVMLRQQGKGALWMGDYDARQARKGTPHALWKLARERGLYEGVRERWIRVGDELAWVLPTRGQELVSGPRLVDPRRTGALRYYGNDVPRVEGDRVREADPPNVAWALLGVAPRRGVSVSFDLAHSPTDEWWPVQLPPKDDEAQPRVYSEGNPLVGVVFGVRDVDVDAVCDPAGVGMASVPMHGWGVLLDGDQVHLARITEVDPDWSESRCSSFSDFVDDWSWEAVASARGKEAPGNVSVEVQGTSVTVRLDRVTRRFTLPEPVDGFAGLVMHGVGYAEVSALEVE